MIVLFMPPLLSLTIGEDGMEQQNTQYLKMEKTSMSIILKINLIVALFLTFAGVAGAVEINPWYSRTSTQAWKQESESRDQEYYVIHSTEEFTLSEFVNSGKFCEWRGKHEWEQRNHFYACMDCESRYWICLICGHARKLISSERQAEWEP